MHAGVPAELDLNVFGRLTDKQKLPRDEYLPGCRPSVHHLDRVGFPNAKNRVQVSTNGGSEPVGSKNGNELFYRSGNRLIEAPVQKGNTFATGAAHVIFESTFAPNTESGISAYDVSPDAQTFYFVQEDSKSNRKAKVNLVLNWPEELKRLAPAHTGR